MGGEGLHLGGGRAYVWLEDDADLTEVAVGKDETNVAAAARLKLGVGGV